MSFESPMISYLWLWIKNVKKWDCEFSCFNQGIDDFSKQKTRNSRVSVPTLSHWSPRQHQVSLYLLFRVENCQRKTSYCLHQSSQSQPESNPVQRNCHYEPPPHLWPQITKIPQKIVHHTSQSSVEFSSQRPQISWKSSSWPFSSCQRSQPTSIQNYSSLILFSRCHNHFQSFPGEPTKYKHWYCQSRPFLICVRQILIQVKLNDPWRNINFRKIRKQILSFKLFKFSS